MASWRYATAEESERFSQLPACLPEMLDNWDVFPVVKGSVKTRMGEELPVPPDMVVKLLQEDGGQSWVYLTEELWVKMKAEEVQLRPEIPVALFRMPSEKSKAC